MKKIITDDGSITYRSDAYNEEFHSKVGAKRESREKFVYPALSESSYANQNSVRILDIGFGLGYNLIETFRFLLNNSEKTIYIDSLEKNAEYIDYSDKVSREYNSIPVEKLISSLIKSHSYKQDNFTAKLHIGDARHTLSNGTLFDKYDIIYLDGFSTKKNTELWTYHFFKKLKEYLNPNGLIITYSSSYPIISAFEELGFFLYESRPVGRKSGGTIASLSDSEQFPKIPDKQNNERINTTGILFYKDKDLSLSSSEILNIYEKDRKKLLDNGVSTIKQYRKFFSI